MRVHEAIADEITRQGIDTVFGLIGNDTMRLAANLETRGIRYVAARHEAGAVTMAAGFAGASGKVGIAIVSRGAGLTNSLTALVSATKAGTPMLVFSGDSTMTSAKSGFATDPKYVDQRSILAGSGVASATPERPATVVHDLREAFARARAGETIAFMVRLDVLESEVDSQDAEPTGIRSAQAPIAIPDQAEVSSAADLIQAAGPDARVIILAGRGAVRSDALPELLRLGQITGSLLATSLMAKSLFAGSPYDLGIAGLFAGVNARHLFAEADIVLAFGASLNEFTTQRGALFPKARVIRIDVDATALERFLRPALGIRADARRAAAALAGELENRSYGSVGFRRPDVVTLIAGDRAKLLARPEGAAGAVDPYRLMALLDQVLPTERAVVVDAAHQLTFASGYLSVPTPDAFFFQIDFQAIGIGLGVAIGVAMAKPDRLTVCSVGDGSFMMTLGELDTAVRYGIPMLILVMNDGGFGAERHYLDLLHLPDASARFVNPSFEVLAKSLGAGGFTINELTDVRELPARLAKFRGPLVVDCKIDPAVRAEWIEFNLRRDP